MALYFTYSGIAKLTNKIKKYKTNQDILYYVAVFCRIALISNDKSENLLKEF